MVVNERSRRTSRDAAKVRALLQQFAVPVAAFHVVSGHDEVRAHVRRAAKAGVRAVLVGGGDGTLAHAVDALAHRDTVLGVLPLGTGNSFARSLGLDPSDLESAVATIAHGTIARVDLGTVNGTHFANFATIGLSSRIAGASGGAVKRWLGSAAYAFAALRPLLRSQSFRARITWRGGRLDVRTQDVIVANGRFFGTTPVAPDASLETGTLALFTTAERSRLGALRTYVAIGLDRQATLPGAHTVSARRFEVRTRPRQPISIDGSLLEKTPARFGVARRALRVFVPDTGIAHG